MVVAERQHVITKPQMNLHNMAFWQKGIFAGALVVVLGLGALFAGGFFSYSSAWADEVSVSDAQAALSEAEAQVSALASEAEALQSEIKELQKKIDATAEEALEAQSEVVKGRDALGKVAMYEYTGADTNSLFSIFFGAESFEDLLRNLTYLGSIKDFHADKIAEQQARQDELDALSEELEKQKEDQDAKLSELQSKKAQAEQVVASAKANLASAKAAEAERLAALEEKADSISGSNDTSESSGSNNNEGNSANSGNSNKPSGDNSAGNSGGNQSSSGWRTGIASAYGGETDPYVDNPCSTATGDICDDWSMGVAIPMAWSNYWEYYGRTVEIRYNGKTVYATVNDCGGMGGGSRSLDLQPGVWKAFGFKSCSAWGLRTVQYRFL